jgi:hypothetical protein
MVADIVAAAWARLGFASKRGIVVAEVAKLPKIAELWRVPLRVSLLVVVSTAGCGPAEDKIRAPENPKPLPAPVSGPDAGFQPPTSLGPEAPDAAEANQ